MPIALLITSLFVLSQSAIFIRFAHAHAAAIGFWRLAISLPVLMILLQRKKMWKEFSRISQGSWLRLFFCGFFLFAHFFTWFLSVQKTSVANSMILFASNPLYTALGAWVLFGEKVEARHGFSLLFCFAGIYFLVRDSMGARNLEGDLLAIACAILFSAYILSSKGLRKNLHNLPFAFATYSFCALFFLLVMLVGQIPFFGYDNQTWGAFAGLAFGSTLLGHSLFTHCLQFFNVNLMSVSTLSEPIATVISAHLIFGEPITKNTVMGFCFITVGILVLYMPYFRRFRISP